MSEDLKVWKYIKADLYKVCAQISFNIKQMFVLSTVC